MRASFHAGFAVLFAAVLAGAHVGAATPGPASLVATLRQAPDESKEQFVLRAGAFMAARQRQTAHETCGSLCSAQDGALAVMLFTSRRSHQCRMNYGCPLSHPRLTAETIHSHPAFGAGSTFSRSDYQLGPGYLVRGRRMYYQNGPGTAVPFPPGRRGGNGCGRPCVRP